MLGGNLGSLLYGDVSVMGRIFISFRFAVGIVVNAKEEEEEADGIVTSMDTTCTGYKMEIGLDRTNIMTNNPDNLQREMLEEVKSFKY